MNNSIDIPRNFNLTSYLIDRNISQGRGDKIAIYYLDQKITYHELSQNVNRLGNALLDLGVEMENRVFLLLYDSPEFAYSLFGAMKIGAVPVPGNTMLKASDYEYMLNDSRAKVLIVNEDLAPLIMQNRDRLQFLKHIIVVGKPVGEQLDFYAMIGKYPVSLEAAPTVKDDSAFWQYSSGTTGDPKGTIHLHQSMVYCIESFAKDILNIGEHDCTFSVAKLFFGYGMGNGICFALGVGGSTVLLPDRPLPEKIFETITKYKPTLFFGVPTAYNNMLQLKSTENYDLSSIRHCVSAGEQLPKPIFEKWKEKFGLDIIDGLGSTEMLHIFISNRPGQCRAGSSGKVLNGYEAKIVNEQGQEVEDEQLGTLLAKGPSSALGYWNKREKTKQTMQGEWINTGDKYYRDQEGYLWYMGRGDDMIKAGGIWVSPLEVENALLQHPAVLECGVVGKPDEDSLVKPLAFAVLNEGYQASMELENELKQFVKNKIAPYKFPRWIRFVSEIPKTATGKLQRFRLRQSVSETGEEVAVGRD